MIKFQEFIILFMHLALGLLLKKKLNLKTENPQNNI